MRYLFSLLCVCALGGALLIGCSEDPCRGDDCPCRAPLSDYCTGSDCPTWAEAIADAMAFCDACEFPQAHAGTCGDFGYVATDCGPYGPNITEYFDASTALVAATRWDDNSTWCGFSFTIDYGPVPDCEREVEQRICEPHPDASSRDVGAVVVQP